MVKRKKVGAPQTMAELLAETKYELSGLKKGQFIVGTIAESRGKTLFIDIGAKNEGIVTGRELVLVKDFASRLKVGDKVEVQVRVPENERGQTLLSLRKAALNFGWDFFYEKQKTKGDLEVFGKEENHGGLVVVAPFGLLGFVPGSQIGKKYNQNPGEMTGKNIKVKVLEVDREKNRLVFSERMSSEPEAVEEERKMIEEIKTGKAFKAKIIRVEPFGIFVKVEERQRKLEGLVHISEVSWEKVDNLSGLYKPGQDLEVMLLNKDAGRLQFSIKRLITDPWETIEEKYPLEKQIKGEVVRIASFGALLRLEPGIEGLVHISKIPPDANLEIGKKVLCFVEALDKTNRRLSLGLAISSGKKLPIYK